MQPTLIRYDDLDLEDIFQNAENMTPEELRRALDVEALDEDGLQAYIDRSVVTNEPLTSLWNGQLLVSWCKERDVPCVLHNLEVAAADLKARGLWEIEPPEPEVPKVDAKTIMTTPIVAAQVARPSPEEAKFLKKVADNPLASDATRKKHDAELRRAAYAQRFANRASAPTPTIVI